MPITHFCKGILACATTVPLRTLKYLRHAPHAHSMGFRFLTSRTRSGLSQRGHTGPSLPHRTFSSHFSADSSSGNYSNNSMSEMPSLNHFPGPLADFFMVPDLD